MQWYFEFGCSDSCQQVFLILLTNFSLDAQIYGDSISCFPMGAITSPLLCVSTEFTRGKGKEVGVPAPRAFP